MQTPAPQNAPTGQPPPSEQACVRTQAFTDVSQMAPASHVWVPEHWDTQAP
jgi:hypothetical protein